MTEIQWLVHIMMEHKLSEAVRQKFIARIGEVEAKLAPKPFGMGTIGTANHPVSGVTFTNQAPSTQRALEKQVAEGIDPFAGSNSPVAVTPQAAQALAERQKAIGIAASGQTEKGRTSPRKF